MADFRIFGASRDQASGTPPSCPRHRVLFRAWITTTRHSAGSARLPQSSLCSRWRLSEGCSTVPPGRAATATPSLPTARRPLRHRRRSPVRSVGESRSGRCAGSFASSHNWLKRGQSPTRLWGTGAQSRCNAVRQLPFEGMRRRRRPCARGSLSARPECSSAQHSRLATATRAPGRWQPNVLRVRLPALAARCAAAGNPALLAIREARVDRPVWVGALACWDPAVSGRYT